MRACIKSKLIGCLFSDGSSRFIFSSSYSSLWSTHYKSLDLINHIVWTGKRVKEQTEISTFVDRLKKEL